MFPSLTRRSMLKAATLAGSGAFAVHPTLLKFTATDTSGGITWSADDFGEAVYYAADWTSRATAFFPRAIQIPKSDVARTFTADWDARLFRIEPLAQLDADDEGAPTQTLVRGAETGSATVSVPPGATTVLFRVAAINLYPQENIGDASEAVFTLKTLDGAVIAKSNLAPQWETATPWAAEVSVSWLCVGGLIMPGVVEVASKGPNSIPAGTAIDLVLQDQQRSFSATIDGDAERQVSSQTSPDDGGLTRHSFTLSEPVQLGATTLILSDVQQSDSVPAEFGAVTPRVAVVAPDGDSDLRVTQLLSIYPVTDSGAQLSTYEPTPNVLNLATEKE